MIGLPTKGDRVLDTDAAGECLWVKSDVLPTGEYCPVISYGDDFVFPLPTPSEIHEYVDTFLRAVATADTEAALLRFLRKAGLEQDESAEIIREKRGNEGDRVWHKRSAFTGKITRADPNSVSPKTALFAGGNAYRYGPFLLESIVSSKIEPVVRVYLENVTDWQWTVAETLNHVLQVLLVGVAVPMDTKLFKFLQLRADSSGDVARASVSGLQNYRADFSVAQQPRRVV